jgi:linalool 8-monooxygenase
MKALIEHPIERQKLIDEPTLIPRAVQEILRWVSPVMHFCRTATVDTTIAGQTIGAGEKVVMWFPSTNRDEHAFANANRFDVARDTEGRAKHLSFSSGIHKCLGQHLATLELRLMFAELLRRTPDMAAKGDVTYLRSNFVHGVLAMPVEFTPTAVAAA